MLKKNVLVFSDPLSIVIALNMRLIGHLKDATQAKTFSDYLAGLEIKNQTEAETDGTWAVWIYSEDHLDKGRDLFNTFVANPQDPKFKQFEGKAAALEEREKSEQENWEKRVRTREHLLVNARFGPLTLFLISVSVVVAFYSKLGDDPMRIHALFMSEYPKEAWLPEVRSGQIWRLITPIFIHSSILHILFNMLWLKDLGTMIEIRKGTMRLALLVLLLAVSSNLGQFLIGGPIFGGMSGVVYGLFGYIWMRGKCDPGSGFYIDPTTVLLMIVWFFFCFFARTLHIANGAHAVGLVVGATAGYWPAIRRSLFG